MFSNFNSDKRHTFCIKIKGFFMKVVLLAGGLGSRLAEETQVRAKTNG